MSNTHATEKTAERGQSAEVGEQTGTPFRRARIGTGARGLVLLPVGWLVFNAGRLYRASTAANTGEVLQMLDRGGLLAAVGLGLLAYGVHQIAKAAYRRIDRPARPHTPVLIRAIRSFVGCGNRSAPHQNGRCGCRWRPHPARAECTLTFCLLNRWSTNEPDPVPSPTPFRF